MKYRQAAFLAAMFDSYADFGALGFDTDGDGDVDDDDDETFGSFMGGDLKRNAWSGIHAAIWIIMTPGFPADASQLGAHASFIDDIGLAFGMAIPFLDMAQEAADGGFTGFDFSQWSVFTDKNADGHSYGKQEYLVRTVVPEPATVILLLSGLVVLFGVGRRRLSQLGDTDT